MTAEELLLGLKDIQPPPEPAWWLIAPVQLLVIFLVISIATIVWFVIRYRRINRLAVRAELELQRIQSAYQRNDDARQFAIELSKWLKQVAMLAFPARQLQGVNGQAWLEFLDLSIGNNLFSDGSGKVFGGTVYSEHSPPDPEQLGVLCEQWLSAVKPRLLQRGRV